MLHRILSIRMLHIKRVIITGDNNNKTHQSKIINYIRLDETIRMNYEWDMHLKR